MTEFYEQVKERLMRYAPETARHGYAVVADA